MENINEKETTIKSYWMLPIPGEHNGGRYVNISEYVTQDEVDWLWKRVENTFDGYYLFNYENGTYQAQYPRQRKNIDGFITSVNAISAINGIAPKRSYFASRSIGIYFTTTEEEECYVLVSEHAGVPAISIYKPKKDGEFDFINLNKIIGNGKGEQEFILKQAPADKSLKKVKVK